jgi:soluble lytic murein transglycosylase-like protein
MRGIGTLSRLPVARALIAGAALLAGAAAHAEQAGSGSVSATSDETAMAIPRVALPGRSPGVALPRPLDPGDAARIRRIFAWQAHGDIQAATRAAAEIADPLLAGHILADRYLGRFRRATPDELTSWLEHYPDLPDAPAVYALLTRRLPKGATAPAPPRLEALPNGPVTPPPLRAGPPDDEVNGRSQAAGAARTLFTGNRDSDALRTAMAVLHKVRPGQPVGDVGIVAGLAAWRLDRTELAQTCFEAAAGAVRPARVRAAAAFWAARAHLRLRDEAGYVGWLRRAAEERHTFYGLIARRTLGLDAGPMPGGGLATEADVEALAATPRGWRAFALLQVGQPERAEAELRLLWPEMKDNPPLRRSVLLIAASVGLTDLAAQLAALLDAQEGQPRDELRVAVPRLHPAGGFRIDPALVYALTRLESNFDAAAVSPAGALGLMQIMPVTARYVMGSGSLGGPELHDPSLNLDVGQRYVAFLGRQDGIEGDLIRLLASYNAGPGNFLRWGGAVRAEDDPLLFIEAIPNDETRAFVQHVLTYTWIYAARLRLPAPSLDEIAAGEFPRFTPLAGQGKMPVGAARVH